MKTNPGSISISFLDLLSGALAGVIILFIIVPKGNTFTQGDLKEQKLSIDSLFIVIDSLYLGEDTLTTIDVSLLRQTMSSLRTKVDSVTAIGGQLQRAIVHRKAMQVQLEDSLRRLRYELRTAKRTAPVVRPPVDIAQTSQTPTKSRNRMLPSKPMPTVTKQPEQSRPTSEVTHLETSSKPITAKPVASRPRDPMPEMLDPFMVDIRWNERTDVDLLLLNKAGVVICNDSRCNKKFAALERSGKRDTLQYERMRLISREVTTYDVRLAIHSGFGRKGKSEKIAVKGDYYIKQSPTAVATKKSFSREVMPRQRGDNGAPGISIGTLSINTDGSVVFNPSES